MKVSQSHRPEIVRATPDGKPAAPEAAHPARPANRHSCSMSCDGGVSPSEPRAPGNSNMVEATARAAAHAKIEPHRRRHACSTRRRINCVVACFGPRQLGDENEDARLRPIRLRTIRLRPAAEIEIGRSRNWPKSRLIGRSRKDGVCSVSSLFLFFLCFVFIFLYFFLVLTHLSLHFVSVLFLFSSPKT